MKLLQTVYQLEINCKYHIAFAPKYLGKINYDQMVWDRSNFAKIERCN